MTGETELASTLLGCLEGSGREGGANGPFPPDWELLGVGTQSCHYCREILHHLRICLFTQGLDIAPLGRQWGWGISRSLAAGAPEQFHADVQEAGQHLLNVSR